MRGSDINIVVSSLKMCCFFFCNVKPFEKSSRKVEPGWRNEEISSTINNRLRISGFKVCLFYHIENHTECVMDLDKLNLVYLGYGGSVLGLSQFLILPQLPQKMTLTIKVVKSDSKIVSLLH